MAILFLEELRAIAELISVWVVRVTQSAEDACPFRFQLNVPSVPTVVGKYIICVGVYSWVQLGDRSLGHSVLPYPDPPG